jgi:transcriptional regulator with XRE-family HTH domain
MEAFMEHERVILKKLREHNKLSLDAAAELICRSKGWLSEIENNKGRSVLRPQEYQRIFNLYQGDKHKRYFGNWIKNASSTPEQHFSTDGAIYKFLRTNKAKITLISAAQKIGISKGFLSKIEHGKKVPNPELKEKILATYGYRLSSWKNFATKDSKRGAAIPINYRLEILIQSLSENQKVALYQFAKNELQGNEEINFDKMANVYAQYP